MSDHLSFGLSSSVLPQCQVEDRAGEQERGVGGGREEGKLEMKEPIFLRDRDELSDVIICLPPSESQPAHLLNTF